MHAKVSIRLQINDCAGRRIKGNILGRLVCINQHIIIFSYRVYKSCMLIKPLVSFSFLYARWKSCVFFIYWPHPWLPIKSVMRATISWRIETSWKLFFFISFHLQLFRRRNQHIQKGGRRGEREKIILSFAQIQYLLVQCHLHHPDWSLQVLQHILGWCQQR